MEKVMVIAEAVDYAPHVEELKNLIRDVYEQANERNLKRQKKLHYDCWLKLSFFLTPLGAHNEASRLVVLFA
jgi:hypothetical protein